MTVSGRAPDGYGQGAMRRKSKQTQKKGVRADAGNDRRKFIAQKLRSFFADDAVRRPYLRAEQAPAVVDNLKMSMPKQFIFG